MRQTRDCGERLLDPVLRDLLERQVDQDTVIETDGDAELSIVDVDTHDWPQKPTDAELEAHLAAIQPTPEAAWRSHGHGLKLCYAGPCHRQRAVAAAFSVPSAFQVELLQRTRHPQSASSGHAGARCGPVTYFETDPAAAFEFKCFGRLSPEQQQAALWQLGLEADGRYDHGRCPIDPGSGSDAKECVVVLDTGIFCHRCASHGVSFRPGMKPGFVPFAALIGGVPTDLDRLAENFVHWTHARLELSYTYPHLGEQLLMEAYRLALAARYQPDDPRINPVFNRNLDFVRGDDIWLDVAKFRSTKVDNDAAAGLPYAMYLTLGKDGEPVAQIDLVRRAQIKFRSPRGYRPIRPVRGISFVQDDAIPVAAPPAPKHPIELLGDPLPIDEAWRLLEAPFPKLDRSYVQSSLASVICVELAGGQPPMVTSSGPSGAAKEQGIRLGASFMGQDIVKLTLTDDEEKMARAIGAAISAGHRFLVFDELAKTPKLNQKLKVIYAISAYIHWRPYYMNNTIMTPARAAFFFPCVRFSDFLVESPEFVRRTRHTRLFQRVPNWHVTSGGDTVAWRDRTAQNAHVGNSLLTWTWRLCREHNFQFASVMDALGLGTLSEVESTANPEVLKALYRHARNEDGRRVLFENDQTFTRGWVDLSSPAAIRLVTAIAAMDDLESIKHAHYTAQTNLEAQAWNDLLGIDTPPIRCVVKIHGTRWGMRFQSGEATSRGKEVINEQLPSIPAASSPENHTPTEAPPSSKGESPTQQVGDEAAAADVLARGGLLI
jgi:hypothetical protein